MSKPRGTRFIPVPCGACGVTHGITTGAAIIAVVGGQDGSLVTTGGNAVCFLPLIEPEVGNDKPGGRSVDFVQEVEA